MSESARFITDLRRCETLYIYHNGAVAGPRTSREFGGYNRVLPEYLEVLDGKRKHLGTCFKENLAYIRRRNNPRDRLIIAQIFNGENTICHCFIVNGNNLHDHSNYRQKCLDLDRYQERNNILRWCEPDREQLFNEPVTDNDLKAAARKLFSGEIGYTEKLSIRTGDWDIAAHSITRH